MSDRTIAFTSDVNGLDSYAFVLEAAENNGKTIFAPSERARLKLYPGGKSPKLTASFGSVKLYLSGLRQTYTEYIAYKNSDKASVTYYIEKLISAVWEGAGSGRPKVYGSRLILPESTTGVMKVTYETSYDLIDVLSTRPTYVLVSAETSELTGMHLLDYTDGYQTDIYNKDVVMTIRDACTRETLPDANVYINGRYTGKSDSEGILRLGSMKAGTYSLKVQKDGYQPTDEDSISNDFFTVE